MEEVLARFWAELTGRWSGPFAFRFILQPAMGAFYAFRDGRKDAIAGHSPYFLSILFDPGRRPDLLREGWQAVSRVVALGIVMDALYQIVVLRSVRPLELIVIVLALAVAPYVLLRGPFNRLLRRRR